ncbi:MAG TPA: RIO1 family regulatory kinase/ATPase [Natrialbaceae archaeon]|nr:RIO1 family regulatory kinase/ATPase [Natrialbaceae archaeon]
MPLRDVVRGRIEWPRLEAVVRELARRYDREEVRVEFLEADNWLSTPCSVDDEWFVKVISPQNSVVHALFTTGRNLGAFSSGTLGFFEHVGSPIELAERELAATERMRGVGVNAPEPIEAFEVEGLGVLVLEYLDGFRTFEDVDDETVGRFAPSLIESLARLHDNHLVHGDLRGENVLLHDDELFFVDATTVKEGEGIDDARAYDLACALATLEPHIGARRTVATARERYSIDDLLAAREFLDFVNLRPDHDFDGALLKGEIEKAADDRE